MPVKILHFIIYLVFCCCLFDGCRKAEIKRCTRCVYDQAVFAEVSRNASLDEQQFLQFKRNPFFNLLWENHTFEEGEYWFREINDRWPFLKAKFEQFRQIDQIGSPRTYHFADAGVFSPSTLRLIAMTGELCTRLGSFEDLEIIQIGAGYGSWCKILSDVFHFKSYTLVDLPEQLGLAKKCLEKLDIKNVKFFTPDELPKEMPNSLVISDRNFSEFDRRYQELFFDRILSQSAFGYIVGYEFPKHFGVISMSLDELHRRFEKMGNLREWECTSSSNDRSYFIYWKN